MQFLSLSGWESFVFLNRHGGGLRFLGPSGCDSFASRNRRGEGLQLLEPPGYDPFAFLNCWNRPGYDPFAFLKLSSSGGGFRSRRSQNDPGGWFSAILPHGDCGGRRQRIPTVWFPAMKASW